MQEVDHTSGTEHISGVYALFTVGVQYFDGLSKQSRDINFGFAAIPGG